MNKVQVGGTWYIPAVPTIPETCEGCIARNNGTLCELLPSTCFTDKYDIIWVEQKNSGWEDKKVSETQYIIILAENSELRQCEITGFENVVNFLSTEQYSSNGIMLIRNGEIVPKDDEEFKQCLKD